MEILMKVIHFVFGDVHNTMATAYMLVAINEIASWFTKSRKKKSRRFIDFIEKLFSYAVFIMLGNILDRLMVNNITGYDGSIQMVVCLELIRREGLSLLGFMEKRHGLSIPFLNISFDSLRKDKKEALKDPTAEIARQLKVLSQEIQSLRQSGETEKKEHDSK